MHVTSALAGIYQASRRMFDLHQVPTADEERVTNSQGKKTAPSISPIAKSSITILAWVNSQAWGPIFHFHPKAWGVHFGRLAQIQYLCVSQSVEHGTLPLLWQAQLSSEEGGSLLEHLTINQREWRCFLLVDDWLLRNELEDYD